jgi:selenocysteine lyase/cysteine desulfurase
MHDERWQLGSRRAFSRLAARAYLAHAAVAPLADDVVAALEEQHLCAARGGVAAIGPALEAAALARERFAALVGAPPADVARVPSTSAGVSAIATALELRAGERIVCFEGEFPTNVTPWQAAARRAGAAVEFVPLAPFERSHEEGLAVLARALTRPARVVAASAVQFQSGLALPLARTAELAHAAGAAFFVDAIQAVGARPIDVVAEGVDALAAAGHKWLMGPLGEAFLYVAPALRARLEPLQVGWVSHVDHDAYLFAPHQLVTDRPLDPGARVFEQGVLPFANYAASAVAAAPLLALTPTAIHAHVQAWHDQCEPRAVALGMRSRRSPERAGRSAILALEPPHGIAARDLVHELGREGVVATCPDGVLRLAPHWPNALDEVEVVEQALAAGLRRLR